MGEKKNLSGGPGEYWHIGPVYVQKRLVPPAVIALSAAVLLIFGLPWPSSYLQEDQPPAYRYDDPRLAEVSGLVRILDGQDRVRYAGEIAAGTYTGRGMVFDISGALVYDGPLADGVFEGKDAKVYQNGLLVYSGEMAGNLYQGQGRRIDPATGTISEGRFSEGRLEGWGQEFTAGGELLREGNFSRDLLEGEGTEYGPGGTVLREGSFSAGLLHGEGREYTPDGILRYEGAFRRGVYHGQGTLYHTLLRVRSCEGTFVCGHLTGQGSIYHPSGQLLYTGQVCEERPRADAFLGLSLAQVEEAFTSHWLLYVQEEAAAFVYPYFQLMFITDSPLPILSPSLEGAGTPGDAEPAVGEEPPLPEDEILSPDIDRASVLITQVLSYGAPLPCLPQPNTDYVSGQHPAGWREWFSSFALGDAVSGAAVRHSGQFIWRFTQSSAAPAQMIDEFWSQAAGVESITAYMETKDMPLWYQAARWKEEA